jgi:hypothetical protein
MMQVTPYDKLSERDKDIVDYAITEHGIWCACWPPVGVLEDHYVLVSYSARSFTSRLREADENKMVASLFEWATDEQTHICSNHPAYAIVTWDSGEKSIVRVAVETLRNFSEQLN